MSFNNALSGVNAAQKDLNVTANNIANVNTTGFKESRAEFADVYANSIFVNAKTQVGNGVATGAVAQQFHQGALQYTNNPFDMAIQGNGFFVLSDGLSNLDRTFTRAGAFKLNESSYIVNNQGKYLQGYEINQDGTPKAVSLNATKPIQIPDKAGEPKMTEKVEASFNLSSTNDTTAMDPANFDPTNNKTFNHSTSVVVYDSLGSPHTMTTYFVRQQGATAGVPLDPPTWQMYLYEGNNPIDVTGGTSPGGTVPLGVTLEFTSGGKLNTTTPATITTEALGTPGAGIITNGADPTQTITIELDDVTQY
ncbi:MAG: flagellar hook protein FlgE, partial [Aeromonas sp.]